MRPVDDDLSNVRSLQSRVSAQRNASDSRMRQKRLSFTNRGGPAGGPSFMTVIEATETRPVVCDEAEKHLGFAKSAVGFTRPTGDKIILNLDSQIARRPSIVQVRSTPAGLIPQHLQNADPRSSLGKIQSAGTKIDALKSFHEQRQQAQHQHPMAVLDARSYY